MFNIDDGSNEDDDDDDNEVQWEDVRVNSLLDFQFLDDQPNYVSIPRVWVTIFVTVRQKVAQSIRFVGFFGCNWKKLEVETKLEAKA